jgi:hypothetical protein
MVISPVAGSLLGVRDLTRDAAMAIPLRSVLQYWKESVDLARGGRWCSQLQHHWGSLEWLPPQSATTANKRRPCLAMVGELPVAPMNHAQSQGTPLSSLMAWDRDGELCSEDREHLLARFLAQELSEQQQDQTSGNKRRDFVSPRARSADPRKKAREQRSQLPTRSRTT